MTWRWPVQNFIKIGSITDGKIDEKYALQIYQNKCVLDIEWLAAILEICLLGPRGTIFFKVNIKIL